MSLRFEISGSDQPVAVVHLAGPLLHHNSLQGALRQVADLCARNVRGIILDCTAITRVKSPGIAAFVDFMAGDCPVPSVAASMPDTLAQALGRSGLDRTLSLFPDIKAALAAPEIRRTRLEGLRALIWEPSPARACGFTGFSTPTALLDVLGRSVLDRVLDHLQAYGIREVIIDAGHSAHAVSAHMAANPRARQSVFQVLSRNPAATTPYEILSRLDQDHAIFDGDILVTSAEGLSNLDLAGLLERHQSSGAEATVAVQRKGSQGPSATWLSLNGDDFLCTDDPHDAESRCTISDDSTMILSREGLCGLHGRQAKAGSGLIPQMLAAGIPVAGYSSNYEAVRVASARGFVQAINFGLTGARDWIAPAAPERRKGLWVEESATVSLASHIVGPCFVGQRAEIRPGARISGPSAVGAFATVGTGAVLRKTILLPGAFAGRTNVRSGIIAPRPPGHDARAQLHQVLSR